MPFYETHGLLGGTVLVFGRAVHFCEIDSHMFEGVLFLGCCFWGAVGGAGDGAKHNSTTWEIHDVLLSSSPSILR